MVTPGVRDSPWVTSQAGDSGMKNSRMMLKLGKMQQMPANTRQLTAWRKVTISDTVMKRE